MKKSFILLSFLVLLLLPIISALQINMNTNLSQGQTLIAQVTGNFLGPIQIQNVLLYNGHVRVSFIPYINDINNTYYIYGQLGQQIPGNYSLNLTGVSYIDPYGQVQNA